MFCTTKYMTMKCSTVLQNTVICDKKNKLKQGKTLSAIKLGNKT